MDNDNTTIHSELDILPSGCKTAKINSPTETIMQGFVTSDENARGM